MVCYLWFFNHSVMLELSDEWDAGREMEGYDVIEGV